MAHTFDSALTGAIQAEAVTIGTTSESARLPDIETSPPFLLMSHPHRWMVVDGESGPELLPALGQLPVEGGIGNVDGYANPGLAIANKAAKGWVVIPEAQARPDETPDGRPGYLRRIRVRRGLAHLTAWETLRVVAGRVITSADEAGYHAWLRRLLADGVVPAPDPAIIEAYLDRARVTLDRAGSRDENNSVARDLVARAKAQVEALEAMAAATPTVPRRAKAKAKVVKTEGGE